MSSTAVPDQGLTAASLAQDELYHTIRNADGSWQSFFGIIENQVSGAPAGGFAGSGCAGVGDALHLVGLGTDARLYHTIRDADATWQSFFGLVEGQVSGGPQDGFTGVSCGGVGDELQVVALGFDSRLYHTIRHADGTWQNVFGLVESQVAGGIGGAFTAVGCAGVGTQLELVGVAPNGQLYHTLRNADGRWQAVFGLVEGQVHGGPPSFRRVACGGAADALHVVGLGSDGQLYHTIRNDDGSWQNFFGLVEGQVHGGPPRFTAVACAGVGDSLQVVGVGSDGQLYHTLRDPNGTWQDFFGLVEGQVHAAPPSFTGVSCGGAAQSLHLVGGTFNGGFL